MAGQLCRDLKYKLYFHCIILAYYDRRFSFTLDVRSKHNKISLPLTTEDLMLDIYYDWRVVTEDHITNNHRYARLRCVPETFPENLIAINHRCLNFRQLASLTHIQTIKHTNH